mgnify:CR=1 FL=1
MALLDYAAERGCWVVEDDYDGEFRYDGGAIPALRSLDVHDRVIYLGSFSKVLFPGCAWATRSVRAGCVTISSPPR